MEAKELREKSIEELEQQLHGLLHDLFKYRTQQAMSQISQFKQTHLLKQSRRDIARIKTVLTEKSRA